MRNLKKVLSTIMAVAMMMSLVVFSTSAAFNDQDKIVNTDAVNMNVALGIINGMDDGSFNPTGNVTRAQMAKMICIALNGGKDPVLGTLSNPTFKDIKGHWAEGYIEYCSSMGIIAGMGDGTFAPEASVTGTQAAKMLLVALGFDATKEGFNGGNWSVSINVRASQKGLYTDLAINPNVALTRDSAAQMIYNALEATMVKYEYKIVTVNGAISTVAVVGDDTYTNGDVKTILNQKFKLSTGYGILENVSYNKTDKTFTHTFKALATTVPTGGTKLYSTAPLASGTIDADKDFSNLLQQQVKVLYKEVNGKTTVYGMYAYKTKVVATGIVDDLGTSTKTGNIKFGGVHYKAETAIGNATSTSNATQIEGFAFNVVAAGTTLGATNAWYSVTLLDVDGNGYVDTSVYMPYTVAKVTYVGSTNITAGNASYKIEDCDVYKGIKKDDYTKITQAVNTTKDTTVLAPVDKMVEGKVTNASAGVYTIADGKYSLATGVTMAVGDQVKSAPVVNTFIFAADTTGNVVITDYAVVVDSSAVPLQGDQAKLLLTDGTKKIYSTDKLYDGNPAGEANIANLVTFTTNADKDYVLTKANTTNAKAAGFDLVVTGGTYAAATTLDNKITFSSSKVKYINNWNIADDAVIFLQKDSDASTDVTVGNSTSYEVISGAKLKTMGFTEVTLNVAYAKDNSSNGFANVQLAYISTKDNSTTTLSYQYGFAVADYAITYNGAGDKVYSLTLWNGKEEVTVLTEKFSALSAVATVNKGEMVRYTLDKNGNLEDSVTVYGVKTTPAIAEVVAVTAYDGKYIQIDGDVNRYEIVSDTVTMYIDKATNKGVTSSGINIAGKDENGNYIRNSFVLTNSAKEVLVIVQEVTNEMVASVSTVTATAADSNAEVAALFAQYNTVVVNGTLVATDAITVPAGKTLVLNNGATLAAGGITVAATGTLLVNAGTVDNASLITGAAAGASVTFKAGVVITASATNYYTAAANAPAPAAIGTPVAANVTYLWADVDSDGPATLRWLMQ